MGATLWLANSTLDLAHLPGRTQLSLMIAINQRFAPASTPSSTLARIIHDGSLRSTHCNPRAMGPGSRVVRGTRCSPVATGQGGAAKDRGVLEQYVEGLSGEPARLAAAKARPGASPPRLRSRAPSD